MKIAQFTDSFLPIVDGVGRVAYSYCDAMAKKGHEVSAVCPLTDMGFRAKYPFEIIDYFCMSLVGLPQYKVGAPTFDMHFHKHLEMKDFEIVHVHTPFIAGFAGIHYAKQRGIPVIGTFHSKYKDDFKQITGSDLLATIGSKGIVDFYNLCDEVWTVSNDAAEELRSYGYEKEIVIVPNGMEIVEVKEEQSRDAKKEYNLKDKPTLLYVGQINEKKNLTRILESVAMVIKDGYDLQLVMAGQGPHLKELQEKTKKLGIENNVIWTGHINGTHLLYGLYALADLFLFPSLYDTSSMVVREAANAKTASVVVKNTAPAEVIEDEVNGYLCDDTNESLKDVIIKALNNPKKLKEIGINAKETIPIPWSKIVDIAIDRYQNLLNEK